MISFNKKDDEMLEILEASQLYTALTKEDFRVYGLINGDDNPPILVEWSERSDVSPELAKKCNKLKEFFNSIGVRFESGFLCDDNDDATVNYKVYIGLRRDIRNDIRLSAAILKTIIYFIDNKLKLTTDVTVGIGQKFN